MMKMINKTLTAGSYESPACSTFEIVTEGLLCSSTPLTINDWVENNDVL